MTAATAPQPGVTASRAAAPLKLTWPRVVRSEWIKLWSLRSSVYTLITAAVVMIGLGLVLSAAQTTKPSNGGPPGFSGPATVSLGGVYLAQLVIAVLGVLLISSEYSTGSIRSTLAAVPARLPVLWAKGVVLAAVILVLMTAATLAAFLGGQAFLSGKHLGTSLSDPGVLRAVFGAALYLTVVALLGLGLGALLRHTAAAIGVVVGLLLVLPILSGLLPASWSSHITKYLPSNAGQAILNVHHTAGSLSPSAGLALFAGYAAAALATAAILLVRRDA